jgi:hypothetical protein
MKTKKVMANKKNRIKILDLQLLQRIKGGTMPPPEDIDPDPKPRPTPAPNPPTGDV